MPLRRSLGFITEKKKATLIMFDYYLRGDKRDAATGYTLSPHTFR